MTIRETRQRNEDDAELERRQDVIKKLFGGPHDMLDFSSPTQLFRDIRQDCEVYNDFQNDIYYDVMASAVLLSYRISEFNATCYLHFHGPPESGKTRAQDTVSNCNGV